MWTLLRILPWPFNPILPDKNDSIHCSNSDGQDYQLLSCLHFKEAPLKICWITISWTRLQMSQANTKRTTPRLLHAEVGASTKLSALPRTSLTHPTILPSGTRFNSPPAGGTASFPKLLSFWTQWPPIQQVSELKCLIGPSYILSTLYCCCVHQHNVGKHWGHRTSH